MLPALRADYSPCVSSAECPLTSMSQVSPLSTTHFPLRSCRSFTVHLSWSHICVLGGLYSPWTCLPRTVNTNRPEPGFKEEHPILLPPSVICFSFNKQVSCAHQATGTGAKAPKRQEPSGRGPGRWRCRAPTWFEQRAPRGVEPEAVWGGVWGILAADGGEGAPVG